VLFRVLLGVLRAVVSSSSSAEAYCSVDFGSEERRGVRAGRDAKEGETDETDGVCFQGRSCFLFIYSRSS
jgi:hypothetical protein